MNNIFDMLYFQTFNLYNEPTKEKFKSEEEFYKQIKNYPNIINELIKKTANYKENKPDFIISIDNPQELILNRMLMKLSNLLPDLILTKAPNTLNGESYFTLYNQFNIENLSLALILWKNFLNDYQDEEMMQLYLKTKSAIFFSYPQIDSNYDDNFLYSITEYLEDNMPAKKMTLSNLANIKINQIRKYKEMNNVFLVFYVYSLNRYINYQATKSYIKYCITDKNLRKALNNYIKRNENCTLVRTLKFNLPQ